MMMIHCVAVYNLIMDSDTKEDNEDFLDLRGTSTKARVKERRIKLDQERKSMAEKTRERVARCRSKKNDEEKKDAELRQAKNQADAVNPGDRLVKAYGKGGGRPRKRSNSRTRRKKRSGRRNRSWKV